jgi:alkylation response protein AidB-like acyl-CoA dehydrogenase
MIRPAGKAFPDDPPLLHAVSEIGPKIRAAGDEMEQMRRIPPHLVQAMKDAGVFGMVLPRSWGAPELDPMTQIRVIEALAIAEASLPFSMRMSRTRCIRISGSLLRRPPLLRVRRHRCAVVFG